ncbi:MAG: TonB family protein [Candidatus Zixiibacteriota bacterium]
MRRDLILSILLHIAIISATFISTPFEPRREVDYGEVIRVSLTSMPELPATEEEPAPLPDLQIPQAVEEQMPEIPIDDPTTKPEVKIDKAVAESEKPKPEPRKPKPYNPDAQKADETRAGSSEGQIESSTTSHGSPFAGATVDNASFNKYPYWYDQAFSKIIRYWSNPVVSDGPIVCVAYFQVIKSGRMIEARIEQSSGIAAFDNACLLALQKAAPFPPLPREFREEIIGITLPFKYEPR